MRKRNCRVEIYFTKDELESLTKKVRKSGLSRESFCRHLLNGAEIKEAPSADVPMLINEVRRVGYNIDQMYYDQPWHSPLVKLRNPKLIAVAVSTCIIVS